MAHIVPGAIWQPIAVDDPANGIKRARRIKGRGAVGHVAVSSSPCLVPSGSPATRGADWHFYLPKAGNPDGSVRFFQFIDLDLQCWASEAGNTTLPAWESEGGLGTDAEVNAEPWTENQLNAGAIIYAHLAKTEGAPLQVMPDSRPTSRGLAAHRFGIDPWRVPGGEQWSGPGKLCPGTAKVAQLAEVIARAKKLLNPTPTPAPVQEDDDMLLIRNASGAVHLVLGDHLAVAVPNAKDYGALQAAGIKTANLSDGFITDILRAISPPAPPAPAA
jgi:hypothetical protein